MSLQIQSPLAPAQPCEAASPDKCTARSRSTSAGSSTPGSGSSDIKSSAPDCLLSAPPGLELNLQRQLFSNAPPGLEDVSPAAPADQPALKTNAAQTGNDASADGIHILPLFGKAAGRFLPPPPCQPPVLGDKTALAGPPSPKLPPLQVPVLRTPLALSVLAPPAHWPAVFEQFAAPPLPLQAPVLGKHAQEPRNVPSLELFNTHVRMPHSPPPLFPPGFSSVLPASILPPPIQAPALCPQIPTSAPGLQKPPSLLPPPPEAPVLGKDMGLPAVAPPPAAAPVFGEDLDRTSAAPPPAHAPTLHLVDMLPTPELGTPALPTVGSEAHGLGACRPCAFLYSKGCSNGAQCAYCHLCLPGEKKRRMKEQRQIARQELAQAPCL